MAPVRGYLRYLGYDARPWGLGVNDGSVEDSLEVFVDRVREAWEEGDGRPVCLIGWSYGGVVARETARRVPDAVRHVFTYGTPVVGGPTYTLGASEHTREALAAAAEKQRLLDERDPIRVPITAFFSRSDHVVHWPSTIDRTSLSVEHISVGSTHLSLGIDPDVWAIIARRLASGAVADRAR